MLEKGSGCLVRKTQLCFLCLSNGNRASPSPPVPPCGICSHWDMGAHFLSTLEKASGGKKFSSQWIVSTEEAGDERSSPQDYKVLMPGKRICYRRQHSWVQGSETGMVGWSGIYWEGQVTWSSGQHIMLRRRNLKYFPCALCILGLWPYMHYAFNIPHSLHSPKY